MMGLLLSAVSLFFCWLLFTLAAYALAVDAEACSGAGLVGRIVIALFVCDATLVIGRDRLCDDPDVSCPHHIRASLCHAPKPHRFIAGERPAVADISTLCSIDFAMVVLEMPQDCPSVARWHQEVKRSAGRKSEPLVAAGSDLAQRRGT
jgi:hypothetical protein